MRGCRVHRILLAKSPDADIERGAVRTDPHLGRPQLLDERRHGPERNLTSWLVPGDRELDLAHCVIDAGASERYLSLHHRALSPVLGEYLPKGSQLMQR